MDTSNADIASSQDLTTASRTLLSGPYSGTDLTIESGFYAQSFRSTDCGEAMDPLVMVDHYVMTKPTFGTHPHAGLSAISLLFSDSEGRFHNRDSLGNDFDLLPGDLYWLSAGRGALHNESPREDSRAHGLQIFVNVPQQNRYEEPSSLLIRRQEMPELRSNHYSVHVALGESNDVVGVKSPGLLMTILDGQLAHNGHFEHRLVSGRNAWVQAIDGDITVGVLASETKLRKGQAIAIDNSERDSTIVVRVCAGNHARAQFVLLEGKSIKEPFVQRGPFVMRTPDDIEAINKAFKEGRFGSID